MTFVPDQLDVIHRELVDVLDVRIQPQLWWWEFLTTQLFFNLFDVIQIYVGVARSHNQLTNR